MRGAEENIDERGRDGRDRMPDLHKDLSFGNGKWKVNEKELRNDEGAGRSFAPYERTRAYRGDSFSPTSTATKKSRHDPAFRGSHAGATDRAQTGCIDLS